MRLALASLLVASAAFAQDAPAPVSDEFIRLFDTYCIKAFPDDAALKDKAGADKLAPLTPAQVAGFLHSDPGAGWLVAGADTQHVLTIENPPYHSCAVRRYAPQVMDGTPLFVAARAFVAASGRTLGAPQTTRRAIGPDIISSGILMQVIGASGQPSTEAFMFFVVSYPAGTKPDGTARAPFYDIRFVRQIYEKPV